MAMAAAALRRRANPLRTTFASSLQRRSLISLRTICSSSSNLPLPNEEQQQGTPPAPGRKMLESFKEEFEIGSRTISIETGKIARFANGSVVLTMDDTNVLSTVASAKGDGSSGFLPLTVDYQEKQYAQGVIPTTFMRREGAPKERELLCGRLIDRPIRPLFPAGFYHDVQIMVSVLSSDGKHDPDVMAANATSTALMLSDIPWNGPIGVLRVGRIDGEFVFNPTMDELTLSDLNLVYACTRDKTLMIDVQAREISEKDLEAGLKLAHHEAIKYIEPQIRLSEKAGKLKKEYKLSLISDRTLEKVKSLAEEPIEAVFTDSTYGKFERGEALDNITQVVKAKLEEECDEDSLKVLPKAVDTVRKRIVRRRIIEKGLRVDGRQLDEVRPLYCEAGTYPILHGSAIFSRGDTQVLCTVTLGAPGDAQKLDSIVGPPTKRFMLHYSFPPFSINEVGKRGGLNRREVGHGTLAEKALLAVLPPEDEFPYTVRINSEVMASDGSTSMATVCGGSMALMDAGIGLREHVAGVSVGLITEVDPSTGRIEDYRILTDILGLEDHLGDMDFKIAGTKKGITAIQLDIKPAGIPLDIICESLEPARKGRIQILDRMEQEISSPRSANAGGAPQLVTLKLSDDSLRRLLGPLGSHRKRIERATGARIAVSDGTVTIVAKSQSVMEKAQEQIDFLVGREMEVGRIYKGVISSIKEYGAFVEFNGGQQGLLHISELSNEQVSKVSDVVSVGQQLSLMCIGQDVRGNIKLSLKATLPRRESQRTNSECQDSVDHPKPAVDDLVSTEGADDSSVSINETRGDEAEPAISCTPSILIRSAADCDAEDIALGQRSQQSANSTKSSPRPYQSSLSKNKAGGFPSSKSGSSSRKTATLRKQTPEKKYTEPKDTSPSKEVEALLKLVAKQDNGANESKMDGTTKVHASSLKLGDRATAKVHQIRAYGLVLELGGGLRGMYKFEVNGRRDFEVGKELRVKCSSFSSKGVPVFSLLEDH
ncbi:putative polyribonucleotide nucleotidyltransferase 2, mitochondrial [Iris pallida]|uniref:Polyribonucleotide nucleotidyltransferase 2, mitochondrial n=1 Tax=Iris pallida TaxID=29817 RepID=A0AAX6F4A7_IRIPA|nr:putative polyribonucleotide nucleotidyltransferase 2, mitochondrial [Iris pallida]